MDCGWLGMLVKHHVFRNLNLSHSIKMHDNITCSISSVAYNDTI